MATSTVHLMLAFLLLVPPVMATRGILTERAMSGPPAEDPCDTHEVACNPTAFGTRAIILVASLVSIIVIAPGCMRVSKLKKTSRGIEDTLFWWYLFLGSGGFFAWILYFWKCQADSSFTAYPLFVASLLLCVIHLCLLIWATCATCGVGDWRICLMLGGTPILGLAGWLLWLFASVNYVGWWGFSLVSLAHAFRVAATNYQDNPAHDAQVSLYCTSMTHRTFLILVSLGGAASGLLWLIHPQLCFSLQYKVTSYAVALARVWESFVLISRPLARGLSKIEGQPRP